MHFIPSVESGHGWDVGKKDNMGEVRKKKMRVEAH